MEHAAGKRKTYGSVFHIVKTPRMQTHRADASHCMVHSVCAQAKLSALSGTLCVCASEAERTVRYTLCVRKRS